MSEENEKYRRSSETGKSYFEVKEADKLLFPLIEGLEEIQKRERRRDEVKNY